MPREACWLGRGPACLDLEGRGTGGGSSVFESWPQGGAAGKLLGIAPLQSDLLR